MHGVRIRITICCDWWQDPRSRTGIFADRHRAAPGDVTQREGLFAASERPYRRPVCGIGQWHRRNNQLSRWSAGYVDLAWQSVHIACRSSDAALAVKSDTPPRSGWLDEQRTVPSGNVSGGRNLYSTGSLFPRTCTEVPGELGRLKGGWATDLGVARCAPHWLVQN